MNQYIKSIAHNEVLNLANQVEYLPGQIVSKTLAQDGHHSLTLFAFDKDSEISTHESDGDAMVICLDGTSRITIDDKPYILQKGETIIMPAKVPHAVYGAEQFKMLLVVIFPS